MSAGPLPWSGDITETPSGQSIKVLDANGGVVCLLKGKRKHANLTAILEAVNGNREVIRTGIGTWEYASKPEIKVSDGEELRHGDVLAIGPDGLIRRAMPNDKVFAIFDPAHMEISSDGMLTIDESKLYGSGSADFRETGVVRSE